MRKYSVILDMSYDKFTFWPSQYQHAGVKNLLVSFVKTKLHTAELHATELHAIKPHALILKPNELIKKSFKLSLVPTTQPI